MRLVVAFVALGAGADIGTDADMGVGVGASDDGENDVTSSSGVAPPEGKTPPRSNSLCRSPRSAGMSMLKSRIVL